MSATLLDVQAVRRRFSSLQGDFVFLDAPGGSQVPDEVGDAIARALREASANIGAPLRDEQARRARSSRPRAPTPAGSSTARADDVIFGTNMTMLDFTLSRTASRDWKEGDRILVSRLDHDGGVAPWIELAADRGFEVDWIDVTDDLRLDLDDLERKLDERVRVVACVASSNAVGTIIDLPRVAELAHAVGALVLGRRGAVRRARAGRRAGARLRRASSARRTSSAARISGSPTAGTSCSSRGGPTRRGPRSRDAGRAQVRDRARRRTSCSPASRRRSRTSSRSAAWRCSRRTSASSARASSRRCRRT